MAVVTNLFQEQNLLISFYIGSAIFGVSIISIALILCGIKKKAKSPSVTADVHVEEDQIVVTNTSKLNTEPPNVHSPDPNLNEEGKDQFENHPNGLKSGPRPVSTRSPLNAKWYNSDAFQFMDISTDDLDKI